MRWRLSLLVSSRDQARLRRQRRQRSQGPGVKQYRHQPIGILRREAPEGHRHRHRRRKILIAIARLPGSHRRDLDAFTRPRGAGCDIHAYARARGLVNITAFLTLNTECPGRCLWSVQWNKTSSKLRRSKISPHVKHFAKCSFSSGGSFRTR